MNLEALKAAATSKFARQVLITQKHSPKILFAAGTIGVIGTVVLACRATLKIGDVLETTEKHVDFISEEAGTEQISHEDANKRIAKIKLKTALEIAKLYVPAMGLGIVSITALTGSHVILTKRNTAVMAAYAGLDRAYKEYRQRVTNEFGADTDRKFAMGTGDTVVEEKTADGKTKTHVVQTKDDKGGGSPYAVLFDESSRFFTKQPGGNQLFIETRQSWANDKLRAHGHLFLNEVYDMLGVPRTKAGACVGWVYRRDNEPKNGDNYVSFGVFEGDPDLVEAFLDGEYKHGIWLDFNVDGMILDLI
jgi:hypothetical protein